MAYLIMPAPGEPNTCAELCYHNDCAAVRRLNAQPCCECGKLIPVHGAFYLLPGNDIKHVVCRIDGGKITRP